MSPEAGDQLLSAVGQAIAEETDGAATRGYHMSGDEFVLQAETEAQAQRVMSAVTAHLRDATLRVDRPDSATVTKQSIEVTHGIAEDKTAADYQLKQAKQRRERVGRGEQPRGVSTQPTEGQPASSLPSAEAESEQVAAPSSQTSDNTNSSSSSSSDSKTDKGSANSPGTLYSGIPVHRIAGMLGRMFRGDKENWNVAAESALKSARMARESFKTTVPRRCGDEPTPSTKARAGSTRSPQAHG